MAFAQILPTSASYLIPREDPRKRKKRRVYRRSSLPIQIHGFSGFGEVLSLNEILTPAKTYVFSITPSFWDNLKHPLDVIDTSAILAKIRERMRSYGMSEVVSVTRGLFAQTWTIVVKPTYQHSLSDWVEAFLASFKDLGYSPTFNQAEVGSVSTRPGGIKEILPEVGKEVGETAATIVKSTLKPLLPYILIGGGVYLLIIFGPSLMTLRRK